MLLMVFVAAIRDCAIVKDKRDIKIALARANGLETSFEMCERSTR